MNEKREQILARALALFGEPAQACVEHIRNVLVGEALIDYVEYTDEMIRALLNEIVYDKSSDNLFTKYIVPPFSVLDTRQGYWTERKNAWLEITGNLSATRDGEFGRVSSGKASGKSFGDFGTDFRSRSDFNNINDGTSNFDPVLAEVMFKWFNLPHGKVLDPFGGEQTKGTVAGVLKMPYYGVEIRQEQVDYNRGIVQGLENVNYVCGDSANIADLIPDRDFDFVFTSPPYYDLEVYSDNKDDLSTFGTFDDFMQFMYKIYKSCTDMLLPNRFFIVKVGEIRDKKTGVYRNFVGETINVLKACGLNYYNEIILLNAVGTASMRASGTFRNRKIVKLHQNILVFYKGDVSQIQSVFTSMNTFNPVKAPTQEHLL